MSPNSLTTSILSSLGNNTGSIFPMATKDLIKNQVTVLTYKKDGGKHDAFEKFVEENGTSLVWLGGLPLIKKLLDKTLYRAFKIDPDVDIRKLKSDSSDSVEFTLNKLKEQGKTDGAQFKALKKVSENKNITKGLFTGKFAIATGLTMFALGKIILYKQKDTEEKVKQKVRNDMLQELALKNAVETSETGKIFKGLTKTNEGEKGTAALSFTGSKGVGALSAFMYNPVLNQLILDGGITGLRIGTGRDGEKRGITLKELIEIAFLYPLALPIQRGFELLYGTIFGKDTSLNYDVLASDSFKDMAGDNSIKNALADFSKEYDLEKIGKDGDVDKKLLNFIYDNPDNPVVKFLKETGDVSTVKKTAGKKFGIFNVKEATSEIDSLAFIDTKSIKKSINKLSKMLDKMDGKGALGNVQKASQYLKGTRFAKGLSILSAIAFGIWGTGVFETKLVLKMREKETGSTENQAITNLESKIRHQMAFEGGIKA